MTHMGLPTRVLFASRGVICLVALCSCSEIADNSSKPRPILTNDHVDSRYMQIRSMLELPGHSHKRAVTLPKLVRPLCSNPKEQAEFLKVAKWSVGFAREDYYLPVQLLIEMLDYISSVCGRESLDKTLDLLEGAESFLPGDPRLKILLARTLATANRYEAAVRAARAAASLGSAHAVALAANIEARRARNQQPGYVPGMYDTAIEIAATEPTGRWHAVDLAAVLSTRARLLLERAFWAEARVAKKSRLEAIQVLNRLVLGPFPSAVRNRAADVLCFESRHLELGEESCLIAVNKLTLPPELLGSKQQFEGLETLLSKVKAGDLVLAVFRGDEQELLEWGRASAQLLKRIVLRRQADLLVIDRSQGPRGSALVERVLALARVKPWMILNAKRGTQTVPCVAALLADRRAPPSCPLNPAIKSALEEQHAPQLAILIGRDLDAEIDDLRLYDHPVMLASFRITEMTKKGLVAWLKSLSDVLAVP